MYGPSRAATGAGHGTANVTQTCHVGGSESCAGPLDTGRGRVMCWPSRNLTGAGDVLALETRDRPWGASCAGPQDNPSFVSSVFAVVIFC